MYSVSGSKVVDMCNENSTVFTVCAFCRVHTDTLDLRARQATLDNLAKMEYLETGERMEVM